MEYYFKDLEGMYLFKKNKFSFEREKILDKLIINNVVFAENLNLDRFANDVRLVEFLCGFKFTKLSVNYKNLFIKNRYLYLTLSLTFKLSCNYICNFIDYLYFFESSINLLINVYNKYKLPNVFKNIYIKQKFIFIGCKLNYIYLSYKNRRRYKKIAFLNSDYFDNNLWLYIRLYFDKIYYTKCLFSYTKFFKLRWNNEKT